MTGFLGYASTESINWAFILPAAVASFAGGQVGARIMSTRLKAGDIRIVFSVVLFAMCIKLIHQTLIAP